MAAGELGPFAQVPEKTRAVAPAAERRRLAQAAFRETTSRLAHSGFRSPSMVGSNSDTVGWM
jgi:hypothetical protein